MLAAAQIEQAPAAAPARVWVYEESGNFNRDVATDQLVVAAPHDMSAGVGMAYVRDRGDGTALVYWTGWRRPEGDHSLGEGRVCRLVALRELMLLDRLGREPGAPPLRVLVPGAFGGPLWCAVQVLGGAP